jgi:hypothetical protein
MLRKPVQFQAAPARKPDCKAGVVNSLFFFAVATRGAAYNRSPMPPVCGSFINQQNSGAKS